MKCRLDEFKASFGFITSKPDAEYTLHFLREWKEDGKMPFKVKGMKNEKSSKSVEGSQMSKSKSNSLFSNPPPEPRNKR